MKKLLIIFLIFLLPLKVCAYEIKDEPEYNMRVEAVMANRIGEVFESIFRSAKDFLFEELLGARTLIITLIGACCCGGVLGLLSVSESGSAAEFACYSAVCAVVVRIFALCAGYAREVIEGLCDFVTKLSPVLIGLLAASGKISSATAFSPVLASAVWLLALAVESIIMPLSYLSAVIAVVGNISDRLRLASLNRLIRSVSKWIMTGMLTIFAAICGIYGLNAPVLDAVSAKTVKFAVGTLVPVVGGLLADTVETVVGGTRMVKNAVGTAGMITVITIAAFPVIKIGVMVLMLRLAGAVCEPLGGGKIAALVSEMTASVISLFSIAVTAAMLFIVSIGIIIACT